MKGSAGDYRSRFASKLAWKVMIIALFFVRRKQLRLQIILEFLPFIRTPAPSFTLSIYLEISRWFYQSIREVERTHPHESENFLSIHELFSQTFPQSPPKAEEISSPSSSSHSLILLITNFPLTTITEQKFRVSYWVWNFIHTAVTSSFKSYLDPPNLQESN